ncbi:cyclin-T1 [Daktulosphaira vitifoliae]|uniref:cyclin-T1 n=1 Tax=Daktulosphaira vitifoliae TaxID=58002 RepID=UPI0021A991B3|nr:cyclin-T1 [Daktulosphaira vitifoliae]XP_050534296.1 cyclin-T1 [Daktulosphaira vitifoliae]
MHEDRWYFTKEQLENSPSKRFGLDADKELSYRQIAANLIQEMGQRLHTTQLCINTAIVYMHRFYMYHPFTLFHRNSMATACLFLAAKNEEQPRKLEHVLKVSIMCLNKHQGQSVHQIDTKSEVYLEQVQDLLKNEETLLKTLGFETAIDHPHTHIVRCCHLVRASKDLAQTAYFMASNSLHLTTMCVQYKPTIVACFCIHLACKWSKWELKDSMEGKPWFWYVDQAVTTELLEQLTTEFLSIFDKCPSRLKKRLMATNNMDKNGALANYCSTQQMQSPVPQLPSNYRHQSQSRMLNNRPVPSKPPVVFQPPTRTNGVPADHKFVMPARPVLKEQSAAPSIPNNMVVSIKPKIEVPSIPSNIKIEPLLPQQRQIPYKFVPKPLEPVVVKQEAVIKTESSRNPYFVSRDNHSEVISSVLKEMTKQNDLNILSVIKSPRESPLKVKKPSIFSPVPEDEPQDIKPHVPVSETEAVIKPEPGSPGLQELEPKFDPELMLNPVCPTGVEEIDGEQSSLNTHKKKKKKHKEEKREKKKHKKEKKHKDGDHHKHKHKDKHKDPEPIRITIPKEKIKQIPPVVITTPHSPPRGIKLKIAKERIGGSGSSSGSSLRIKISKEDRGVKREHSPAELTTKKNRKEQRDSDSGIGHSQS